MLKIWRKVQRGGFLFSLIIGLLVFSLINLNNVTEAAVTKMFYYQGQLENEYGKKIIDGNVNMKFRIYDTLAGGSCLWSMQGTCDTPTSKAVAVKNGIFSAPLGGVGDNSLDSLDFTKGAYFLEVQIDYSGSYQTLYPRRPVNSVAQSINTNNLISDGKVNITGVPTGSGVGQGTVYINPPSASSNNTLLGLAVRGSLKAKVDAEGDMELLGRLTTNALTIDTNPLFVDVTNNRVGIGTTTPESPLSINLTNSSGISVDFLGSVGINTTAPSEALEVVGNVKISRIATTASEEWAATSTSSNVPSALATTNMSVWTGSKMIVWGMAGTFSATGGSVTYDGDYTVHTFTSSGTFQVSTGSISSEAEVLIVAGGGGGGTGGGGAGGLIHTSSYSLSQGSYTVTVGNGGSAHTNGQNSVFNDLTAYGGGYSGNTDQNGNSGGSGGGGGQNSAVGGVFYGGSASPSGQGNSGGTTPGLANSPSGGGGGAGAVGANGVSGKSGDGGVGLAYSISGTSTYYAGGGGGGIYSGTPGSGGLGGGGNGRVDSQGAGYNATANTGGGGGGGATGGSGGSGIVIIRYRTLSIDGGSTFDPITNTWKKNSNINAPLGRTASSIVWTGSKMIVWGGIDSSGTYLNDGGIYDPTLDTWTTITTTNAPTARKWHHAVWTGSKMIVWGGQIDDIPTATNTGGIYDPIANTWTSTSTTGAPTERTFFTLVWTGSKMIVWGGMEEGVQYFDTGGIYDPVANTWSSTSTSTNCPSARLNHTAVWTGSKMIVWGGYNYSLGFFSDGGIYDLVTNSWSATSNSSPPSGRVAHTAVWTGSKMIVWGGEISTDPTFTNTGGSYDPVANSWSATSTTNAPAARYYHTAAWTGSKMIIWGGADGSGNLNTGGVLSHPGYNGGPAYDGGNLFVEGDALINGELKTVGPITSGGFYSKSGADIAETYLSKDNLEPGTLITPDILTSGAISISKGIPYDNTVIGVVSTLPGMTLGYGSSPNETYPYSLPIALAGRVPVRVSDENGQINVGDPITSSSIPGVAMKAINEGNTLGTALESFDPATQGEQCISNPEYTCSKILAYVSMSYIRPSSETELRIEDITLNLSKQVKEQEDKITALESELDGLSTKLTNITFGEDSTNITGEVGVESLINSLNLSVLGNAVINEDLIVTEGDVTFNGNVVFNKEVDFKNNMVFEINPVFSSDTAGMVTISKGSNQVLIKFNNEYSSVPLIFANISIPPEISAEDKEAIVSALKDRSLRYFINNQSINGFDIVLSKEAPADIIFTWKAINVSTTTTTTIKP